MDDFHLQLDYYGALNLHKALLEAKFHLNPDNELVSGSPFVADVYVQIREWLIKSDPSGRWEAWFQLKNRPDYRSRAILRMKTCRRWDRADPAEKEQIAGDFLAPFLYDESQLNGIITEVDRSLPSHGGP